MKFKPSAPNGLRFAWLIPVSVARLLHIRDQEKVVLRNWQRTRGAGALAAAPRPVQAGAAVG